MNNCQTGILDDVPSHARYLVFSLKAGQRADASLLALNEMIDGKQ
jgi:hypothetical protein